MNIGSKVLADTDRLNVFDLFSTENTVLKLLELADIRINGNRPWDMQVYDNRLYGAVLAGGSLALGEAYMDGWWEAREVDQFIHKLLSSGLDGKVPGFPALAACLKAKIFNMQSRARAFVVAQRHYDLGNDIYRSMLDRQMIYSCGYWENADSLQEAQEAKLELVCSKLGLKPGQKVLDIGCGWGGFAKYAAEKYGVRVCGITVSKEQFEASGAACRGLPAEFRLQDYRELREPFDHIVSIGMFEHVGYKNYREFMKVAGRCLKPRGLFLLHTIGGNRSVNNADPWINKYIFPNGMIPSAKQLTAAAEGLFVIEDWQNIGIHYDKTLMAWYENFRANWNSIKHRYDKRFYRMWKYYLLSSAASFRARKNQVWQVVFSKRGLLGGYKRTSDRNQLLKMNNPAPIESFSCFH